MFCCKRTRRYERIETEFVIEYQECTQQQSLRHTIESPIVKLAFSRKDSDLASNRLTHLLCAPQKLMDYASSDRTTEAKFLVAGEQWTLELTKEKKKLAKHTSVNFEKRILELAFYNAKVCGITEDYSLERASRVVEALNVSLPNVMKQLESDAADCARFQETYLRYESRFSIVRYGTRAKFATMPQWMATNGPMKFAFECQGEIWVFQSFSRVDINPEKRLIGLPRFNLGQEFHHPAAEFDHVLSAINQAIPEWERVMAEEKAALQERDKARKKTKQEEEERKMQ